MSSNNRKKLRAAITLRRDAALSWCVRQLMLRMSSTARRASMASEIRKLDKPAKVQLMCLALDDAMLRAVIQLRETRAAQDNKARADEKRERELRADALVAARRNAS